MASINIFRPPWLANFNCCRNSWRRTAFVSDRLGGGEHPDPLFDAALTAASLRFQESLRPDPLFIDPFAGCFLSSVTSQKDAEDQGQTAAASSPCHYRVATKFIDDKLISTVSSSHDIRQIVLLTDGMDTRPYRLSWPSASIIYDISPGRVFKEASQLLEESRNCLKTLSNPSLLAMYQVQENERVREGVGAKISRACMIIHIPQESSDLQAILCKKGFSGSRPSLWVLQGLPLMTLERLIDILGIFSGLAVKGCIFIGELHGWLLDADFENMSKKRDMMERIFMRHGLQVDIVGYDEVARNLHLDLQPIEYGSTLFIARQLQYSDAQMETWRAQFERLEEEGDEEGFEEL